MRHVHIAQRRRCKGLAYFTCRCGKWRWRGSSFWYDDPEPVKPQ